MATTFAILSNDGETPNERDRLNKSLSCLVGLIFRKGYYLDHWIYSC